MLSLGRRKMKQYMKPHLKYIKRVHTDEFICNKPINIKMGDGLGKFKMMIGRCRIVNANKVIWDNDTHK